jgi:hypothetical protein
VTVKGVAVNMYDDPLVKLLRYTYPLFTDPGGSTSRRRWRLPKLSSTAIFEIPIVPEIFGRIPLNRMYPLLSPPLIVTFCSCTFLSEIAVIAKGPMGRLAGYVIPFMLGDTVRIYGVPGRRPPAKYVGDGW